MEARSIQQRAIDLFMKRFLREAEEPTAETKLRSGLGAKVSKLATLQYPHRAQLLAHLHDAQELWNNRRHLEKRDLILLTASLLYFLSPVDAVPDPIPILGYSDDLGVLAIVLRSVLPHVKNLGGRVVDSTTDYVGDKVLASVVPKAITTVVIGLWGATTMAALSLALSAGAGGIPKEWLVYVLIVSGATAVWNFSALFHFLWQWRRLKRGQQRRLLELVVSKVHIKGAIIIGVPVAALLALGIARGVLLLLD